MNDTVGVDDLTELWNAGAVSLPTIAVRYSSAASSLHSARFAGLESSARFDRTGMDTSPVWEPLNKLTVLLQDRVMAKSSDNCLAAGNALVKIAENYATTDHLNSRELDRYRDFKVDVRNGANPPPDVAEAPYSDEPHPEVDVAGPGDFPHHD